MKQVEATVQVGKMGIVSEAINDIVGGFAIMEGNARGSNGRQIIRSGEQTPLLQNTRLQLSRQLLRTRKEKRSAAIMDAAYAGKGDGIIMISDVESVQILHPRKPAQVH